MLTFDIAHERWAYDPETGIFTWKIKPRYGINIGDFAGCKSIVGYLLLPFKGKLYYGHRVAWLMMTGEWPKSEIDHINQVKGDDRWCNLRDVTRKKNANNSKARVSNKTGIKGVQSRVLKGRTFYVARITVDGKDNHLGCFKTLEEAKEARLRFDGKNSLIHGLASDNEEVINNGASNSKTSANVGHGMAVPVAVPAGDEGVQPESRTDTGSSTQELVPHDDGGQVEVPVHSGVGSSPSGNDAPGP